eukprot:9038442-Pyramimonas_sp.AAC.2
MTEIAGSNAGWRDTTAELRFTKIVRFMSIGFRHRGDIERFGSVHGKYRHVKQHQPMECLWKAYRTAQTVQHAASTFNKISSISGNGRPKLQKSHLLCSKARTPINVRIGRYFKGGFELRASTPQASWSTAHIFGSAPTSQ